MCARRQSSRSSGTRRWIRRSWRRPRSSRGIAVEHSTRIATISGRSSSGPPTWGCWCSKRAGPTSSCTARRLRIGHSPRRRSTGGSRPSAASTASRTSTAESLPTRRSTSADPRSTRPTSTAWTDPNLGPSCSPPSGLTGHTPLSRSCSGSTGFASARRAQPTSRTSASSAAIGRCGYSARATSPPSSRSSRGPPEPSTSPSVNATRARSCDDGTDNASTGAQPTAGCAPSANGPASGECIRTCSELASSWPPSTCRESGFCSVPV
jgi:hypothetical protein